MSTPLTTRFQTIMEVIRVRPIKIGGGAEAGRKWAAEVAAYMAEHCQPWIKEVGVEQVVYRGTDREIPTPLPIMNVRDDRRSLGGMPDRVQDAFDQHLKASGATARRMNSVFVTSDKHHAQHFGPAHVIIPIGTYSYTFFPAIGDANHWTTDQIDRDIEWSEWPEQVAAVVPELHVEVDSNIKDAIRYELELMIRPDSKQYLAIKLSMWPLVREAFEALRSHAS